MPCVALCSFGTLDCVQSRVNLSKSAVFVFRRFQNFTQNLPRCEVLEKPAESDAESQKATVPIFYSTWDDFDRFGESLNSVAEEFREFLHFWGTLDLFP